jgi:NAD(P)-dependent dehydrogenase (short-subunit alcohol dehydrogenase family)
MARSLEGKVALVTGAGSGIGRTAALAFAREGAKVLAVDIDAAANAETARLVCGQAGEARAFEADVTDEAAVEEMVAAAVRTWGRLDCAHNNAGIAEPRVLTADIDVATWDRVIDINLKGVWLGMKYQIRQMLEQAGGGSIVNTASVVGLAAVRHQPAYVASKHGVIGLTKAAALEYAEAGIRVNAVCPAAVHTPSLDGFFKANPYLKKALIESNPSKRIATPDEVAGAVVWLCSDAASFVTGHALVTDGGVLAQ